MAADRFKFYHLGSGCFVLRRAGVELDFETIEDGLTFARTVPHGDNAVAEVFDAEGTCSVALSIDSGGSKGEGIARLTHIKLQPSYPN